MAILRTDFVDDELDVEVNTRRKYRVIENSDGTISLEDVTTYLTQGDDYGSAEVNEQNEAINDNSDAIEQINSDLSAEVTNRTNAVSAEATARQNGDNAKVNKSGDAMTGNLTIKNTAPAIYWDQLNSDGTRNAMVQANISSGGVFYLYNTLLNKEIVKCTKAGAITFNGVDVTKLNTYPKIITGYGQIANDSANTMKGYGTFTAILYSSGLAEIHYQYNVTQAGTDGSNFYVGLNRDLLKTLNANLPTITPVTGGNYVWLASNGTGPFVEADRTRNGYGTIHEAKSQFWLCSRNHNGTAIGGLPANTYGTNHRINGVCFGTFTP